MARPRKVGLDYFPLDCTLDDKVEFIDAKHGNDGFAVWVRLLQAIYQTESGEFNYSEVFRRITAAKRANISLETWEEIVQSCLDVGLFDKTEFEAREVLTSDGIKKRIDAVSSDRARARERSSSLPPHPPLLKEKKRKSKVKESKVKETPHYSANNSEKLIKARYGENSFVLLSDEEHISLTNKYNTNTLNTAIDILDAWISSKPGQLSWFEKKYSSAYAVLNPKNSWVWQRVAESNPTKKTKAEIEEENFRKLQQQLKEEETNGQIESSRLTKTDEEPISLISYRTN